MNKVTFGTLKIQGFGNIINLTRLKLEDTGLHIIRGPNGKGKTTAWSALTWVCYNSTLKPGSTPETWEHKRPTDWEGTMVGVSLTKGRHRYKFIRCSDFQKTVCGKKGGNRLIVLKNGKESKLKAKRDLQKLIESILGMSFKLFTTAVVFPQKFPRFLELKGPDKKSILEESFRLTWITQALQAAKDGKDQVNNKLENLKELLEARNSNLTDLQQLLKNLKEAEEEFQKEKNKNIIDYRAKVRELKGIIKSSFIPLETLLIKQKDLNKEINDTKALEIYSRKTQIDSDYKVKLSEETRQRVVLKTAKEHIDKLGDELKRTCPFCKHKLSEEDYKIHLEELNSTHKKEKLALEIIEGILTKLGKKALKTDKVHETVIELEKDLDTTNTALSEAQTTNGKLESARVDLGVAKANLKKEKEKTYTDISKPINRKIYIVDKQIKRLLTKQGFYDEQLSLHNWAIKEPLSNTGIKAVLFDQLLHKLNSRLAYYERFTNFGVELSVDLESGRKNIDTIVTKEGYPVNYLDISGGECLLINQMVALAQGDVLLQESPINLRVFDEVDGALDDQNTELIATILKNLGDTNSVFVITHNKRFNITGAQEISYN